jgi:hypothetical protein
MKLDRQLRLTFRALRVEADKKRKILKEDSIRRGKAVDGVYHVIEYLIVPIEQKLEEAEKFAEREEAAAKAKLKKEREDLLIPFDVAIEFYDLAEMPEANFARLLDDTRRSHAAKVEEKIRANNERIAQEKKDAISALGMERNRMLFLIGAMGIKDTANITDEDPEKLAIVVFAGGKQAHTKVKNLGELSDEDFQEMIDFGRARFDEENKRKADAQAEKDRKEKEEKDRLQREKEESDRNAKAAKAEADRLQKQIDDRKRADAEAERKRKADEAKAARLPDRKKLEEFAKRIEMAAVPEMKTLEGKGIAAQIRTKLNDLAEWIEGQSAAL